MSSVLTVGDIVARLRGRQLLTDAEANTIDQHLASQDEGRVRHVVAIFMGIGAWIAALCFMGIGMLGALEEESARVVAGLALLAVALFLQRQPGKLFLRQLGVALALAGKMSLVSGLAQDLDGIVAVSVALWAVTYLVLPDPLDRFITTVATLVLTATWLVVEDAEQWVQPLVLILLATALFLFTRPVLRRSLKPLVYALVSSAPVLLLIPTSSTILLPGWFDVVPGVPTGVMSLPFAGMLICVYAWAAGDWRRLSEPPLLATVLATALLGLVSTPGVLAALALLVLAFGRRDRPLQVLGYGFLCVFLVAYYYQLEVVLLTKSILLMASGLVLLVLRALLHWHPSQKVEVTR
jgi:hypothetical protein